MTLQPTGTVTFLFSDIEGSTRLLQELGPQRYERALHDHRRLLRKAFSPHAGYEVGTEGDSFSWLSAAPATLFGLPQTRNGR